MEIQMTFKHMDGTDGIKTHVNEKTQKITKFLGKPHKADWVFFVEGPHHVAELRVHGPHVNYFAESKTSDLYHSIDETVHKMETQLRKHKEKLKDHLHKRR